MTNEKRVQLPIANETAASLRAGDLLLLSGTFYTGRDAAHARMIENLNKGGELPFDIKDQLIYYVGPSPAKPGYAVGSAGPTSSYRMDPYTPRLIELGLRAMLGKGNRSAEVISAMRKYSAVYLTVPGGAAALISRSIVKSEVIAYEDLGTEAVHRFTVKDMPVIVTIDSHGNNLYEAAINREAKTYIKK
ncbi:MAG: Fe-S-containing hydro-lyase [Mogibacterium sp.]|nr:Fe-S-containing hydro-lyase [Mogibacterium sp.]